MPWTHSLIGSSLISLCVFLISKFLFGSSTATSGCYAAVTSLHWFEDLPMHVPDLPITMGEIWGEKVVKYGWGLWHYRWPSMALELGLWAAGFYLLHQNLTKKNAGRKEILGTRVVFGLGLVLMCIAYFKLLPIPTPEELAKNALFFYFLFPAVSFFFERNSTVKSHSA
jgi:hypothetical protein